MGIEAQHAYRFGYLKSEQWQTVRIEALARECGRCQFCEEFSLSNDAHHIEYPPNVWDTTSAHLVILCRPCHDLIHAILTAHGIKLQSLLQFKLFGEAIRKWKTERKDWLYAPPKSSDQSYIHPEHKKSLCCACKQPRDNIEPFVFYEKFEWRKLKISACLACRSNASRFVNEMKELPEKKYKVYSAWKKQRKIEAIIEAPQTPG